MTKLVYLLWLENTVLDVFASEKDALVEAAKFRNRPEYAHVSWVHSRTETGARWSTNLSVRPHELDRFFHVSRLEVEERLLR